MRQRGWRRRMHRPGIELNVVPLIDVVFFLLVFYVISTSFVREAAVPIERPASSRASAVDPGYLPVAVTRSGEVWVASRAVEIEQVRDAVAAALSGAPSRRVVVVADREVPTWLLLRCTAACADGGAEDVSVAATRAQAR